MKRHFLGTLGAIILVVFRLHAQDIKLMSFNMQQPYNTNWDGRVNNAANIINTHQPDIIGTQELHEYMRNQILDKTSGYASFGISRECSWNGESSYILYKASKYEIDLANSGNFWFKDDYWNCGRGYDPDYNRICTYARFKDKATGKYFYVYNSHFPIPGYAYAREQSANLLMQRANSRAIKDPVIFTGDFNSTETQVPINIIKNGSTLKMRDTYRDVYPTGSVTTGFGTRYDFIFVENKSTNTTLSSYVVNSPVASDHLPIVATVRLAIQSNAPVGQYIWLRNQGKYVSSNDGDLPITCDRASVDNWEKFYVVNAGSGKVALRGSNGQYISAETGTVAMNCNRPAYDEWEKFTWVTVSTNKVALLGYNGRYVSSENGATTGMICNRPAYDGWEIFDWSATSQPSARMSEEEEPTATIVEVSFYPNPYTDRILFANPDSNTSVSIYDLSGQLVLEKSFEAGTHTIDMTDFNKGFYIAKVQIDDQIKSFKLLKK